MTASEAIILAIVRSLHCTEWIGLSRNCFDFSKQFIANNSFYHLSCINPGRMKCFEEEEKDKLMVFKVHCHLSVTRLPFPVTDSPHLLPPSSFRTHPSTCSLFSCRPRKLHPPTWLFQSFTEVKLTVRKHRGYWICKYQKNVYAGWVSIALCGKLTQFC